MLGSRRYKQTSMSLGQSRQHMLTRPNAGQLPGVRFKLAFVPTVQSIAASESRGRLGFSKPRLRQNVELYFSRAPFSARKLWPRLPKEVQQPVPGERRTALGSRAIHAKLRWVKEEGVHSLVLHTNLKQSERSRRRLTF